MYDFISRGLCNMVGMPQFGSQDRGVSPGGAMDQFSMQTANILLDNPPHEPVLEMVIAPEIRFRESCYAVLTGGGYDAVSLTSGGKTTAVAHAVVFRASADAVLRFGNRTYGFRSYFGCRVAAGCDKNPEGRARGPYPDLAGWSEMDNVVRVIEGPEYSCLDHPEYFVDRPWKISSDISRMGMRLTCLREMPGVLLQNMISGPVADGTVQLTPGGPIILLRHRQTVGGYPRIFNVISADVDKLGQFAPGQIVRFRRVSDKKAFELAAARAESLGRINPGDCNTAATTS